MTDAQLVAVAKTFCGDVVQYQGDSERFAAYVDEYLLQVYDVEGHDA